MVQGLRLWASSAGAASEGPDLGTGIPHASWPKSHESNKQKIFLWQNIFYISRRCRPRHTLLCLVMGLFPLPLSLFHITVCVTYFTLAVFMYFSVIYFTVAVFLLVVFPKIICLLFCAAV